MMLPHIAQFDIVWEVNAIILLLLSFLFSTAIIAFDSDRHLINPAKNTGETIIQRFISSCYRYASWTKQTLRLGKIISLVSFISLVFWQCNVIFSVQIPQGFAFLLAFVLIFFIILVVVELAPRWIVHNKAHMFFCVLAWALLPCCVALLPIIIVFGSLSRLIVKQLGIDTCFDTMTGSYSKDDLDEFVQSSIDSANSEEDVKNDMRIFQNALEFSDIKVRDCMIPRREINSVDIDNCTVEMLMRKFIETGHSKIVVYKEDIDHIQGYIHSSEMFKNAETWKHEIRTMPFVPEAMPAQQLMQKLLMQKKSMAVVVDEFGGTSGIIALEDIVEQIFGDIEDEYDSDKYIIKQVKSGEYLLSARLEIEKVNETFNLSLPESDDYKTIGGLILNYNDSLPKPNEIVKINGFKFKILKKTLTKIELVMLYVPIE